MVSIEVQINFFQPVKLLANFHCWCFSVGFFVTPFSNLWSLFVCLLSPWQIYKVYLFVCLLSLSQIYQIYLFVCYLLPKFIKSICLFVFPFPNLFSPLTRLGCWRLPTALSSVASPQPEPQTGACSSRGSVWCSEKYHF